MDEELHDLLYRLYESYETERVRELQDFVDLFPPLGSSVALDAWQRANDDLTRRKDAIRANFPAGETLAEVAAHATRDQAFTALDLLAKYGRAVNVLVLDVDETLRSAGRTDNEIPRETLHLLTELHGDGVPIVICTGQTLENVKGFLIQGLGNEIVHSGGVSVVYESGTGVFTPGHGPETKVLLYENLDRPVRETFDAVRSRVLSEAPRDLRRGCHLQGNEFNVTLKPNAQVGSPEAERIVEEALVYLLDLLGEAVVDASGWDGAADAEATPEAGRGWTRATYAAADPEIRAVLEARGAVPDRDPADAPAPVGDLLDRIDVAYYEGDAAEITSLELNKAVGVERSFDVLGIEDPFGLVMGDSKSDLRVMEWFDEEGIGIAAAPEHGSRDVVAHAARTDGLVFGDDGGGGMLRIAYAMDRLARLL